MSTTSGAPSRSASWSTPSRRSLAASTATRSRSPASSGIRRRSSSRRMNRYSCGSGTSPKRYISASLPSSRSASVSATSDPSASPSGFSWVVRSSRSCPARASATALRSVCFSGVWSELIDEPGEPNPLLDRLIVLKAKLRGSLQPELPVQLRLEERVARLETGEGSLPLPLRPEDAHVHRRLPEIGRHPDCGHCDEPDPRILQVGDPLGDNLAYRFVHLPHPLAHSTVTTSRSARRSSYSWPRRYRSASSRSRSSSRSSRATQVTVSPARCHRSW